MVLARSLLKLWKLRIWVAVGVVLATATAIASVTMLHSTVYASASTEMLVDSPQSALANAGTDLTGYLTRADVFARLMTSDEALQYIGKAAGVPGNLIAASGPLEVNGAPVASHAPAAVKSGNNVSTTPIYKLEFNQNPLLPTIEVNAEAPTTSQAIALANGAVSGFSEFLNHLEAGSAVPAGKRIVVSELGAATGGMVDPGASKKLAAMIFIAVLVLWCGLVLFANDLRRQLRAAKILDTGPQAVDQPSHTDSEYFVSGAGRLPYEAVSLPGEAFEKPGFLRPERPPATGEDQEDVKLDHFVGKPHG